MTNLHIFICVCSEATHRNSCCVDEGMLRCDWNELDYRIDICRVTKSQTCNICSLVIQT
jgi:hypothetical protein